MTRDTGFRPRRSTTSQVEATPSTHSISALDEILRLEKEDKELSDRIHGLRNTQTGMIVTFSILSTILLGLIGFAFRAAIMSWVQTTTALPPQQAPAIVAPVNPANPAANPMGTSPQAAPPSFSAPK